MCIVKVVNDSFTNCECIFRLTNYALVGKPYKRIRYYGGYNVVLSRADEEIVLVKQYFQKTDKRLMRHFTVSFDDETSAYDAWILSWRIAAYYADRYQIVFGVHEDTDNLHIHFVMNTVSFVDGLKYSGGTGDLFRFTNYVNKAHKEYLSNFNR